MLIREGAGALLGFGLGVRRKALKTGLKFATDSSMDAIAALKGQQD